MRRTLLLTPLIVIALGVSAASVNSLTRGDASSQPAASAADDAQRRVVLKHRPDLVVDVDDIGEGCNETKFRNKVIEVTGTIRRISLSPPSLELEERDQWFGGVLTCAFTADSGLAKMADAETVTARGLLRSCGIETTLVGCVISPGGE